MTLISGQVMGIEKVTRLNLATKKCALNVLLERVSRLTHITKLASKKALATSNAIGKQLSIYPPDFCLSITYDNGSENTGFKKVAAKLKNKYYFCELTTSGRKEL